jgi:hypothetical protein
VLEHQRHAITSGIRAGGDAGRHARGFGLGGGL